MKFSIRDLLLVTVIVALALGWWAHRRAMHGEYRRLESENESLRIELLEERFPKTEAALGSQSQVAPSHTLEWIPRAGN